MFALHSSLNHHCRPNAKVAYEDDEERARASIYAVRPIEVGDEVCISYFGDEGLGIARKERQRVLREQYLFDCDCSRCTEDLRHEIRTAPWTVDV